MMESFIWKGNLDTETDLHGGEKKAGRLEQIPPSQPSEGAYAASILISELHPTLEPGDNTLLWLKPLGLWYLVLVAPGNQYYTDPQLYIIKKNHLYHSIFEALETGMWHHLSEIC